MSNLSKTKEIAMKAAMGGQRSIFVYEYEDRKWKIANSLYEIAMRSPLWTYVYYEAHILGGTAYWSPRKLALLRKTYRKQLVKKIARILLQ